MLTEKMLAIVTRLKKSFGENNVEVNSYDEAVIKVGNRPFITVTFNPGAYNVYCPEFRFYIDKYYNYNTYISTKLISEIKKQVKKEKEEETNYDTLADEWIA